MRETLGWIYREHGRGLFLLAQSITRCRADAEDAVHEVFARMCRKIGSTKDVNAAYVFAAVRNAAVDRVRGRKSEELAGMSLAACLESTDGIAAMAERDRAIADAVDELPEDLRIVVFLRVFAGMTFREIGELVESPLQTVASRYSAGLERLRPGLRKWL